MHRVRILLVEDERKLAQVLASALRAEHYDVVLAPTGEDGFFRANAETFDLVLLDLMLPGRNGLEILQTLRKRQVQTPVLILTALDGIDDRVLGLDLGADDYLVKPFALPELLARIRALLRRGRPTEILRLKAGDLELDLVLLVAVEAAAPIRVAAREGDSRHGREGTELILLEFRSCTGPTKQARKTVGCSSGVEPVLRGAWARK
jgi:two-component system copper resistance phosphate regulon response regulator CusR